MRDDGGDNTLIVDNTSSSQSDLRDRSRQLDVHTWSEWPEVNDFVDELYHSYFSKNEQSPKTKKYFKVLLLDLYVAWTEGWKYISMARGVTHYKPKSRYNALHISKKIIEVADHMAGSNLIKIHPGVYDRGKGKGYVSRIQVTQNLIQRFLDAKFPDLAITSDWNRETLVLRDGSKKDTEYDDTPETVRMREVLTRYNDLLRKTHVDCCHLKEPRINRRDGRLVRVGQHAKFVRRVFNEGSWNKGGRFYGGFWQQIPSADRQFIRIDGERTVEIDYSGLHIVLLYAAKGKNYWSEVDGADDPYAINVDGLSDDEARSLGKLLLLMSINAVDETSSFNALRSEINSNDQITLPIKLTNDLLKEALDQLKGKHPLIADKMCSGAGIDLQNVDGSMTESLINSFTSDGMPILCIHDSYIVPSEHATRLRQEMEQVFVECTDVAKTLTIEAGDIAKRTVRIKQIGYDDEYLGDLDLAPDADNTDILKRHKDMIEYIDSHTNPNFYERLNEFRQHLDKLASDAA